MKRTPDRERGDQTINDPPVVAAFPFVHGVPEGARLLGAVEFLAKVIEEMKGQCQ
jgi:hypothetical protein